MAGRRGFDNRAQPLGVRTGSPAWQLDIGPCRFPERAHDDPQPTCAARHGRPEGELAVSFASTGPAPAARRALVLLAQTIHGANGAGGGRGRPPPASGPTAA